MAQLDLNLSSYFNLPALLNNHIPIQIEQNTGNQAAINGFRIPLTPKELEKKDKT